MNDNQEAVDSFIFKQQAALLADDTGSKDSFGYSVSVSGDGSYAVVGAPDKVGAAGAGQGAAYVFLRSGTTWMQQAKLLASDPADSDRFGYSVSISDNGNYVMAGATYEASVGSEEGAAYIFSTSQLS